MCCGKMVKLPNERERTMLTTGDISIDLDKENREKKDDITNFRRRINNLKKFNMG